eukprot:707243_1
MMSLMIVQLFLLCVMFSIRQVAAHQTDNYIQCVKFADVSSSNIQLSSQLRVELQHDVHKLLTVINGTDPASIQSTFKVVSSKYRTFGGLRAAGFEMDQELRVFLNCARVISDGNNVSLQGIPAMLLPAAASSFAAFILVFLHLFKIAELHLSRISENVS